MFRQLYKVIDSYNSGSIGAKISPVFTSESIHMLYGVLRRISLDGVLVKPVDCAYLSLRFGELSYILEYVVNSRSGVDDVDIISASPPTSGL